MNVVKAVQNYIEKITSEVTGISVLLLDAETTQICSAVFTASQLTTHDVYLVSLLDTQKRDLMKHVKAIILIRASQESIDNVCNELKNPSYGDYYICKKRQYAVDRIF